MIDSLIKDLHYAFRMIRRNPAFTVMATVSLALGIGANTAIFTLIHATMLRQLPLRAPEELVAVGDPSRPTAHWEGAAMVDVLSYPMYERLRDRNRVFTGLLASGKTGRVDLSHGAGAPESVRGRFVSGNYFDVLGVSPVIGRTFTPEEDRAPGASPVVVISDELWESRFQRDANVIGRPIRLNGSPFTIAGVAPRDFTGEVIGSPTDVWIPIMMQAQIHANASRLKRQDSNWLLGLGRLKPGVTIDQARAELTVLAQQALAEFEGAGLSPGKAREIAAQKIPVQPGGKGFSWVRKNLSALLFTLMGVVGLVLVIACANVANLLLARATSRQKEISVRLAVGASRWRVIRQLLTEGAVLSILGGTAGLLIAGWGSRLLSRLASRGGPNPVPFDVDVQPDLAVLGFTVGVSILTAMLFGLVPAIRSTRVDLLPTLKDGARTVSGGGWSWGRLLVVGQIALSVPLLIIAGLFLRSLSRLETLDVGYSRDTLVLVKAELTSSGYTTAPQQLTQARALIERLSSLPGVAGATMSENGLFSGTDSGTESLEIARFEARKRDDRTANFDQIGPRYFQILGIPIVAGREFDERDAAVSVPVAIVNETMAAFYFANRSPLGEVIKNGNDRYTIVGVVKDNRQRNLKGRTERRFYIPLLQNADPIAAWNFAIRTRGDSVSVMPAIRRELRAFDPGLNVSNVESVRVLMGETLTGERTIAQLSGLFGAVALFLAIAGLYGVTAYATSRRTGEIGLRMALGADRMTVIRMIVREAVVLMIAGVAAGLPVALVASRLASANLTGVSPNDPIIIGGAILLLLVAGVCAGAVPAFRASRVDPLKALRQE
jgi:predicted permease